MAVRRNATVATVGEAAIASPTISSVLAGRSLPVSPSSRRWRRRADQPPETGKAGTATAAGPVRRPVWDHLRCSVVEVLVTGASGFVGAALMPRLVAAGHRPVAAVRGRAVSPGVEGVAWDPDAGTIDAAALDGIGGVVHLAGAGIADKRWTESRKRLILESRTKGTSLLVSTLVELADPPARAGLGVGRRVLRRPRRGRSWSRTARRGATSRRRSASAGRRRRSRPPTPGSGW